MKVKNQNPTQLYFGKKLTKTIHLKEGRKKSQQLEKMEVERRIRGEMRMMERTYWGWELSLF